MGLPAVNLPFPVLDFGWVLDRLPPEVRAELVWAKKPIADGTARLRTEELTDALVDEVAVALRRPIIVAAARAWQLLATMKDMQDLIDAELEADRERLRLLLSDDDARDTLEWVMEFFQSFVDAVFSESVSTNVDVSVEELEKIDSPPFRAYLRGSIALMALTEMAKQGSVSSTATERAKDLLDVVFLELMEFSDQMADVFDVPFEPPATAPAHHGERLALYAQGVRNALSDADWETIESARMGNLR